MPAESKMAYIMHVDWDWIKQRPHFIYEELTKYYKVDLFYIKKMYNKPHIIKNPRNIYSESNIYMIKKIPFSGRFSSLQVIENLINNKIKKMLEQYDYIWITSPLLLDFISIDKLEKKVIIYDCMDNFLGFQTSKNKAEKNRFLEISLVERAELVFTSSEYLKNNIVMLYKKFLRQSPIVVNNAISLNIMSSRDDFKMRQLPDRRKITNLMYIGTIGEWMDFELIQQVLSEIPDVKFTMVGPVDTKVPSHPRLQFVGAVDHSELPRYACFSDALIMPFKLTELVRSVDPVKIYEYISFGKPIFAIDYNEMYKFLPFVYLYSDGSSFIKLIMKLQENQIDIHSREEAETFLRINTWKERTKEIVAAIEGEKR